MRHSVSSPPRPTRIHPQGTADRAKKVAVLPAPLAGSVPEFFQTDAISRASRVMAKCVKARTEPLPSERREPQQAYA